MIESWHFSVNCKYHLISYCISKKYSNFRIYICCSFEVVHHLIIHFFFFLLWRQQVLHHLFLSHTFFYCTKLNFYIISRFMHLKNHNIIDVSVEPVIYCHHSFSWCPHISHCSKCQTWFFGLLLGICAQKYIYQRRQRQESNTVQLEFFQTKCKECSNSWGKDGVI